MSYLCTLPSSVLSWLTFVAFAIVSAGWQIRRCSGMWSTRRLWSYCFPNVEGGGASFVVDFVTNLFPRLMKGLSGSLYFFAAATSAGVVKTALGLPLPDYQPSELGYFGFIGCALICFVVADLSYYLTHYLQHRYPLLWELHKIHHSATLLTPLTTKRKHPFSEMFDQLCANAMVGVPIGVFGFFFGMSILEILTTSASVSLIGEMVVLDALKHSNFAVSFGRLDAVLISPHMHQLHHSEAEKHWNKNFGNKLSIWDHLFGTKMMPVRGEALTFGIGAKENEIYRDVLAVYCRPIARIAAMVWRSIPPPPLEPSSGSGEPVS